MITPAKVVAALLWPRGPLHRLDQRVGYADLDPVATLASDG